MVCSVSVLDTAFAGAEYENPIDDDTPAGATVRDPYRLTEWTPNLTGTVAARRR